jgi:hypothetical protein
MADPINITWPSQGLSTTIYDMDDFPNSIKLDDVEVISDIRAKIWEAFEAIEINSWQDAILELILDVLT